MPEQVVTKAQLDRMLARGGKVKKKSRKPLPDDASLDQRLDRLFRDQTAKLDEISQRIEKSQASTEEVAALRREMMELAKASKIDVAELVAGIKEAVADLVPRPDENMRKLLTEISKNTRLGAKKTPWDFDVQYDEDGDVQRVMARPIRSN